MITEIKLNDSVSIFKSKIDISDVESLIRDIKFNLDFSINTSNPTPNQPGIQSNIIIFTKNIDELNNKIINTLFSLFNLNEVTPYYTKQWAYISENTNKYIGWHTHTDEKNCVLPPKWTYTYYVQMPDNLIDDDGKLAFKLEDDTIHKILPENGDLYIFPSTLKHTPMSNTNSVLERIVIAGVWSDLDMNVELIKRNKTLF